MIGGAGQAGCGVRGRDSYQPSDVFSLSAAIPRVMAGAACTGEDRWTAIHNFAVRTGKVGNGPSRPAPGLRRAHHHARATLRPRSGQWPITLPESGSRDRHAVAPCMSRDRPRPVRRARRCGRPGAGGITEQPQRPRHTADDIPSMEQSLSLRNCEASRCDPPSTAP